MHGRYIYIYIYEVKSLSHVQLFATPWTVYIYIYTHTHTHTYIYIYTHIHTHTHIFIHSSVIGQVGCFHIFAVVNSAAMNIVVNVSFLIIALSGYMPGSGIANSYGNFLVFWGSSILFSTVAASVPTNSIGDFVFSTPSPAFVIYRHFIDAVLTTIRWYLPVVLICIALIISSVKGLIMCLLIICVSSLEICLFRPAHFFLIYFFEMHVLFVYFGN